LIEVPLHLSNQARWELLGRVDSVVFFAALVVALPAGSTMFLEGTSIADDVEAILSGLTEPGAYLPARQTLSASKTFRLPLDLVMVNQNYLIIYSCTQGALH
jgi:hypothetical protein